MASALIWITGDASVFRCGSPSIIYRPTRPAQLQSRKSAFHDGCAGRPAGTRGRKSLTMKVARTKQRGMEAGFVRSRGVHMAPPSVLHPLTSHWTRDMRPKHIGRSMLPTPVQHLNSSPLSTGHMIVNHRLIKRHSELTTWRASGRLLLSCPWR